MSRSKNARYAKLLAIADRAIDGEDPDACAEGCGRNVCSRFRSFHACQVVIGRPEPPGN